MNCIEFRTIRILNPRKRPSFGLFSCRWGGDVWGKCKLRLVTFLRLFFVDYTMSKKGKAI
jgi:hypothetical protein